MMAKRFLYLFFFLISALPPSWALAPHSGLTTLPTAFFDSPIYNPQDEDFLGNIVQVIDAARNCLEELGRQPYTFTEPEKQQFIHELLGDRPNSKEPPAYTLIDHYLKYLLDVHQGFVKADIMESDSQSLYSHLAEMLDLWRKVLQERFPEVRQWEAKDIQTNLHGFVASLKDYPQIRHLVAQVYADLASLGILSQENPPIKTALTFLNIAYKICPEKAKEMALPQRYAQISFQAFNKGLYYDSSALEAWKQKMIDLVDQESCFWKLLIHKDEPLDQRYWVYLSGLNHKAYSLELKPRALPLFFLNYCLVYVHSTERQTSTGVELNQINGLEVYFDKQTEVFSENSANEVLNVWFLWLQFDRKKTNQFLIEMLRVLKQYQFLFPPKTWNIWLKHIFESIEQRTLQSHESALSIHDQELFEALLDSLHVDDLDWQWAMKIKHSIDELETRRMTIPESLDVFSSKWLSHIKSSLIQHSGWGVHLLSENQKQLYQQALQGREQKSFDSISASMSQVIKPLIESAEACQNKNSAAPTRDKQFALASAILKYLQMVPFDLEFNKALAYLRDELGFDIRKQQSRRLLDVQYQSDLWEYMWQRSLMQKDLNSAHEIHETLAELDSRVSMLKSFRRMYLKFHYEQLQEPAKRSKTPFRFAQLAYVFDLLKKADQHGEAELALWHAQGLRAMLALKDLGQMSPAERKLVLLNHYLLQNYQPNSPLTELEQEVLSTRNLDINANRVDYLEQEEVFAWIEKFNQGELNKQEHRSDLVFLDESLMCLEAWFQLNHTRSNILWLYSDDRNLYNLNDFEEKINSFKKFLSQPLSSHEDILRLINTLRFFAHFAKDKIFPKQLFEKIITPENVANFCIEHYALLSLDQKQLLVHAWVDLFRFASWPLSLIRPFNDTTAWASLDLEPELRARLEFEAQWEQRVTQVISALGKTKLALTERNPSILFEAAVRLSKDRSLHSRIQKLVEYSQNQGLFDKERTLPEKISWIHCQEQYSVLGLKLFAGPLSEEDIKVFRGSLLGLEQSLRDHISADQPFYQKFMGKLIERLEEAQFFKSMHAFTEEQKLVILPLLRHFIPKNYWQIEYRIAADDELKLKNFYADYENYLLELFEKHSKDTNSLPRRDIFIRMAKLWLDSSSEQRGSLSPEAWQMILQLMEEEQGKSWNLNPEHVYEVYAQRRGKFSDTPANRQEVSVYYAQAESEQRSKLLREAFKKWPQAGNDPSDMARDLRIQDNKQTLEDPRSYEQAEQALRKIQKDLKDMSEHVANKTMYKEFTQKQKAKLTLWKQRLELKTLIKTPTSKRSSYDQVLKAKAKIDWSAVSELHDDFNAWQKNSLRKIYMESLKACLKDPKKNVSWQEIKEPEFDDQKLWIGDSDQLEEIVLFEMMLLQRGQLSNKNLDFWKTRSSKLLENIENPFLRLYHRVTILKEKLEFRELLDVYQVWKASSLISTTLDAPLETQKLTDQELLIEQCAFWARLLPIKDLQPQKILDQSTPKDRKLLNLLAKALFIRTRIQPNADNYEEKDRYVQGLQIASKLYEKFRAPGFPLDIYEPQREHLMVLAQLEPYCELKQIGESGSEDAADSSSQPGFGLPDKQSLRTEILSLWTLKPEVTKEESSLHAMIQFWEALDLIDQGNLLSLEEAEKSLETLRNIFQKRKKQSRATSLWPTLQAPMVSEAKQKVPALRSNIQKQEKEQKQAEEDQVHLENAFWHFDEHDVQEITVPSKAFTEEAEHNFCTDHGLAWLQDYWKESRSFAETPALLLKLNNADMLFDCFIDLSAFYERMLISHMSYGEVRNLRDANRLKERAIHFLEQAEKLEKDQLSQSHQEKLSTFPWDKQNIENHIDQSPGLPFTSPASPEAKSSLPPSQPSSSKENQVNPVILALQSQIDAIWQERFYRMDNNVISYNKRRRMARHHWDFAGHALAVDALREQGSCVDSLYDYFFPNDQKRKNFDIELAKFIKELWTETKQQRFREHRIKTAMMSLVIAEAYGQRYVPLWAKMDQAFRDEHQKIYLAFLKQAQTSYDDLFKEIDSAGAKGRTKYLREDIYTLFNYARILFKGGMLNYAKMSEVVSLLKHKYELREEGLRREMANMAREVGTEVAAERDHLKSDLQVLIALASEQAYKFKNYQDKRELSFEERSKLSQAQWQSIWTHGNYDTMIFGAFAQNEARRQGYLQQRALASGMLEGSA